MANEAETKRWNDERWAAAWPQRERLTEAVRRICLPPPARRRASESATSAAAAAALTIALAGSGRGLTARSVGYDISAPLLDLARRRPTEAGVANVRFVEADVQAGGWDEAPFDLAVSQFGVMFFDEPTAAFAAIRRASGARRPLRVRVLAGRRAQSVAPRHGVARPAAAAPGSGAGEEPGRAVRPG